MRHFRQVFSEVMDFVVVDAPHECPDEPPRELKRFLAHSGRTHYRSWLKFASWEPESELSPEVVFGLQESVGFLVDALKT